MTEELIELNQVKCDKCDGTGQMFSCTAYLLFRRWRLLLVATQKDVALALNVDAPTLGNFEKGRLGFSNQRQVKLAEILSTWEQKR